MFCTSVLVSIHRLVIPDIFVAFSNVVGCWYITNQFQTLMVWQYDELLHNYIPCCLIFISNITILIGIKRANPSRDAKITSTRKPIQDGRILMSLMLISTLYVIFMMPASACFSYNLYLLTTDDVSHFYLEFVNYLVTFCDEFSMMNFCFNFIIYGCTIPFYRKEAMDMFRLANFHQRKSR
jgi:hypothetical protein